jgi:O-antigen ligase/polysaccharide polymerase Wzy-like membrane protein
MMASGALASVRRELRDERLPEMCLFVAVVCLVATMLIQAPLAEMDAGVGRYLVRSWDLVSLAIAGIAAWWLIQTDVTLVELRAGLTREYLLFALWVLISVSSLALTWATFGSDGLLDSLVRGLRLVGVLALAIIVSRIGRGRRGEQLVVALLVVAATAASAAAWAWLTREKTVAGEVLAVTRAGGPFGNYFADGVPDQWWAGPAGPNNLGLWLAVAVPTLMMGGAHVADIMRHRILGWVIVAAGLLVLLFGLAATHSRESWIAAAVAVAVLVFVRPNGTRRRGQLLGLGTGVVLAIAVFAAVPSVAERVSDTFTPGTFSYETGPQARLDAWKDGLHWGWERFPIGWGLGAMEEHPEIFGRPTAESVFLQSFVASGVLGPILLVAACASALLAALRRYRTSPHHLTTVFPAAFFAAFSVHGLFGNSLPDPTVETLFGCALGLLLIKTRKEPHLESKGG